MRNILRTRSFGNVFTRLSEPARECLPKRNAYTFAKDLEVKNGSFFMVPSTIWTVAELDSKRGHRKISSLFGCHA